MSNCRNGEKIYLVSFNVCATARDIDDAISKAREPLEQFDAAEASGVIVIEVEEVDNA